MLPSGCRRDDTDPENPVEYDRLRWILPDAVLEIDEPDRGVTLSITDDEKVKPSHHVLGKLDDLTE